MSNIICSGALFYALDSERFLFLHRTQGKKANVWGIVGGTNEKSETPWISLKREISEEIGEREIIKSIPLETFVSSDKNFCFHTYVCFVKEEFMPDLNHEHDGYAWVTYGKWPNPLHYGLKNTLAKKYNKDKLQTIFEITALFKND